jgi:uncharacterized protein YprB with RNaseH-like and TPR domain
MDSSNLADRLRAIVGTKPGTSTVRLKPGPTTAEAEPGPVEGVRSGFSHVGGDVARVLGGEWLRHDGLSCFVVARRHGPETTLGRDRLSTIAARLADASAVAPLVMRGDPARPPFVFFDLETTGLSGGAGTYAFLVGCGAFDAEGGFITRQFVLLRHADERQLLQMVGTELAPAGALVSFNGKSFDAPLIETRHLFHRLEWTGSRLPHLDLLHPARRFWGDGAAGAAPCSLVALERSVLGARRPGDVPGSAIPARYFQFVRSGDARPLAGVLEHNRLDLLSLAGLTARLLDLVRAGPGAARHPREALALGRAYAGRGFDGRAREAYESAIAGTEASMAGTEASMASIRIAALRALALLSRRGRHYEDAAAHWRELLALPGCSPRLAREASEALAVHHEHRARDLPAARAFALLIGPAGNPAVQHRLARIERKMNNSHVSSFTFEVS